MRGKRRSVSSSTDSHLDHLRASKQRYSHYYKTIRTNVADVSDPEIAKGMKMWLFRDRLYAFDLLCSIQRREKQLRQHMVRCMAHGQHSQDVSLISRTYTRLLLKYDDGKKDKVVLAATGEGNPVEAIKPLLQADQVHFAYAKIVREGVLVVGISYTN